MATLSDLVWVTGLASDGVLVVVSEVMEMKLSLLQASATLNTVFHRKMS